MKIAVSACLLGYNCKYNGENNFNQKVYDLKKKHELVPICPEIYGDLPTPRIPAERINECSVCCKNGINVTKNYENGAILAYKVIKEKGIKIAILKSKSPSCGKGFIYDGSFTHTLKEGNGVTTDLLIKEKIKVYTEEEDWKLE